MIINILTCFVELIFTFKDILQLHASVRRHPGRLGAINCPLQATSNLRHRRTGAILTGSLNVIFIRLRNELQSNVFFFFIVFFLKIFLNNIFIYIFSLASAGVPRFSRTTHWGPRRKQDVLVTNSAAAQRQGLPNCNAML